MRKQTDEEEEKNYDERGRNSARKKAEFFLLDSIEINKYIYRKGRKKAQVRWGKDKGKTFSKRSLWNSPREMKNVKFIFFFYIAMNQSTCQVTSIEDRKLLMSAFCACVHSRKQFDRFTTHSLRFIFLRSRSFILFLYSLVVVAGAGAAAVITAIIISTPCVCDACKTRRTHAHFSELCQPRAKE